METKTDKIQKFNGNLKETCLKIRQKKKLEKNNMNEAIEN